MMGSAANVMLVAATATAPAQPVAAAPAAHTATTEQPGPAIGFPPFEVSTFPSQIFWLVLCFGALYLIMSRVAVPRLAGIVTTRRDHIDGDLAEAVRLRKATDQAIADYEAALADARKKAHAIAEQNRTAIKADLDGKRGAVEADLAKKLGVAEASIAQAKGEALGKVDEIAADTAATVVRTLVGTVSTEQARAAVASVVKG